MGEQEFNGAQIQRFGLGRIIDYNNFTEEHIKSAIQEVLLQPEYMQNMLKYRRLLVDNAVEPLERAAWVVEHVIRTKGATHLRASVMRLNWSQENLLDVGLIILLGLSLIILVPSLVICVILRKANSGPQTLMEQKGKKKKKQL